MNKSSFQILALDLYEQPSEWIVVVENATQQQWDQLVAAKDTMKEVIFRFVTGYGTVLQELTISTGNGW